MAKARQQLASTGLIFFGTISSLFNKIIYGLQGEGRNGKLKFFRKPWASTAVMFLGMAMCLPLSFSEQLLEKFCGRKQEGKDGEEALLETNADAQAKLEKTNISTKDALLVAVPCIFDLAATVLMSIGLLSVTASVYQMLRGAEMLFAALFSVTILKRKLNKKHYTGLFCCFVGIVMVGASSLLSGSGNEGKAAKQIILGMALIVIAQAVQAAQITVEDYVLRNVGVAPLTVVGWEGVWGCIFMFGILLPIVQHLPGEEGSGLHEDSLDTWHMICNSIPKWTIPTILIATGGALMLYNVTGMFVTDSIGAVARTVLESLRTLFVWLADLALFYIPLPKGLGEIGEKWDRSSYLQALGFVILVIGTLIYGRGDEEEEKQQEAEQQDYMHLLPKKAQNFMVSKVHSIAGWTKRSSHSHHWRQALHNVLADLRNAHDDVEGNPDERNEQRTLQAHPQ